LFPRNAQANKTIRQSSIDSIHIFPKDELETMINERGSEEEDLLSALKDVKQYLAELEAQPKSKTPKKPSTPIAKKTKSPKNTGQEDIYSFSKGLQRTFSSRRRTTVDLNESDYTIPTKKIKGHAKDLNDHGPPQEGTEYPESSSQANGNYTEKILTKVVSPINESKEKTDIADGTILY
jgi:hypothetical protein